MTMVLSFLNHYQNEPQNSNPTYPTCTMTPDIEGQIGATLRSLLNSNGLSSVKLIGYEVGSFVRGLQLASTIIMSAQLGQCRNLSDRISKSKSDSSVQLGIIFLKTDAEVWRRLCRCRIPLLRGIGSWSG